MNDRTREVLRQLWNEPFVFKAAAAVLIFGNMIVVVAAWQWLAPDAVESGYRITAAVSGAVLGGVELLLLGRLVSPGGGPTTRLVVILAVGAVAAVALSVWVGTQMNDRPRQPAVDDSTRQQIRAAERQMEENREAIERVRALAATRPAGAAGP